MARDKWPYTAHMRNRNYRAKYRNRERKEKERLKYMDTPAVNNVPISPRMRNIINLIISKSEELGKLAAEEGNDGMVALAAMANETFTMLVEEE